jgi:hypothetical protein
MTDREQDLGQLGPHWRMKISREREIYAEAMLDAENIRREFGCSRSKAYEHLHAALAHFGIVPEPGKQLRIRWSIWQRYKQSRIPWARADIGSPNVDWSGTPRPASPVHQTAWIRPENVDAMDVGAPATARKQCPGAESNHRHGDFQSPALPTELPGRSHLTLPRLTADEGAQE